MAFLYINVHVHTVFTFVTLNNVDHIGCFTICVTFTRYIFPVTELLNLSTEYGGTFCNVFVGIGNYYPCMMVVVV